MNGLDPLNSVDDLLDHSESRLNNLVQTKKCRPRKKENERTWRMNLILA